MAKYRLGVDVGGTFTDLVALDGDTGRLSVFKVFTTPEDETEGTLAVISLLTDDTSEVVWFGHGFTVGLNAVLTRTGAKTGLLCTQGHRDILDFGRMHRPQGKDLYNPSWMRPHVARPLISRRYRRGLPGITIDGRDFYAVCATASEAVERARRGEGPTLIEAKTVRWSRHSAVAAGGAGADADRWKQTDPLPRFRAELIQRGLLSEEKAVELERSARQAIEAAVAFALESPDPQPDEIFTEIYA